MLYEVHPASIVALQEPEELQFSLPFPANISQWDVLQAVSLGISVSAQSPSDPNS